jgi:hypothetical protein
MSDFDVGAFVAKLERLGIKLTAVPLADGKMRISRWRMLHAIDAKEIESVWASQIGENRARIDMLAAHLAGAPAKGTMSSTASTASSAAAVRPAVPAAAGDAKTRDRPNPTTSSAAPVRPLARTGETEAKSKDRLEATGGAMLPVRPSTRTGETDAKSKDRLAGRPTSVGSSPSPVRSPAVARRNG